MTATSAYSWYRRASRVANATPGSSNLTKRSSIAARAARIEARLPRSRKSVARDQGPSGTQDSEADPQDGTVPLQNVNLVPRRHSGRHGTLVPKSVWREALETHLIHFQVGALPLEEPVYRLVLAPPEEHENRLAGDRHLEGTPDHRDRVPGDADLHAGQLFDDSSRLPPRADEPRPDLGDPILGVREVFDIEDLQVALVVEETERPVFGEPAGHRLHDISGLQGQHGIGRGGLVDGDIPGRRVDRDPRPSRLLEPPLGGSLRPDQDAQPIRWNSCVQHVSL